MRRSWLENWPPSIMAGECLRHPDDCNDCQHWYAHINLPWEVELLVACEDWSIYDLALAIQAGARSTV